MTPDQRLRLAAKRHNESVKLVATSLNAIALAVLGTAFVIPAIGNIAVLSSPGPWILLFVAIVIHLVAHAVVRLLRSEE